MTRKGKVTRHNGGREKAVVRTLPVRHPNVYTDTSGVRRFDLLAEAVRRAGAAKVIFGSDGPWLHPRAEEAAISGGNLMRLLSASAASPARSRAVSAARDR
jgi:hypothetical protein